LNCVGGEGSAYSDTYLQSLLLEWIPEWMRRRTVHALSCRYCIPLEDGLRTETCSGSNNFLTCPIAVSSFLTLMAISRWPIVISVADRTENTMFRLLLWSGWETSHHCQHYRSRHRKCSCYRHVGLASGC
jgi:hypothetical protein